MVPDDRADCIMEMFSAKRRMLEDAMKWSSTFDRVPVYEKVLRTFVEEHTTELDQTVRGRGYLKTMSVFVEQSHERAATRQVRLTLDNALEEVTKVYDRVQKFVTMGSVPLAQKEWCLLQDLLPRVTEFAHQDKKIDTYISAIPPELVIPPKSIGAERYRDTSKDKGNTFTTQPPRTPDTTGANTKPL